jgi:hypothetical protein
MHYRAVAALVLGATLAPAVAEAQVGGVIIQPTRGKPITRVATRGAAFLSLGVGARALGLGGVFAATSNDLSSMYWNVAGLADVQGATAFLSQERLYGRSGLRNNYIALATPALGGAAGVSITNFSSGKMTRTTEEWPEGNDPQAGSFVEWSAMNVGVHYARSFTDRLAFGLSGKYATEGIQFARAGYIGADVGIRFRTGLFGSTIGASIANLGGTGRMSGPAIKRRFPANRDPLFPTQRTLEGEISPGTYQMPTMLRFAVQTDLLGGAEALLGGAGSQHRISTFADINDAVDTDIMPGLAAEYAFRNRFFLRVGTRFLNDDRGTPAGGSSAGGGVAVPIGSRRFLLDYAYRNNGELESNHVFSFQLGY